MYDSMARLHLKTCDFDHYCMALLANKPDVIKLYSCKGLRLKNSKRVSRILNFMFVTALQTSFFVKNSRKCDFRLRRKV